MALAVAEPADPTRQALGLHLLARQLDPPPKLLLLGKELEDSIVGLADVLGVAGDRRPAEGPWPSRNEALDLEGVLGG